VKTSNPGSGDLQDQEVKGEPVYRVVARSLGDLTARLRGPETGWSSLGVVVGATYPEQGERIRELMPGALFLIPGYSAQGGSAADAVRGFVAGPSGLEGGIVSSSRGLMFPQAAAGASDAGSWERAIDAAIDRASDELATAVKR
jgi:orotidine-5'-phosphate decarboxylase